MRLLVLSQYFWPENFSINAMVESLYARGINVEVLTGKPNYPEGRIFPGYHSFGSLREQWKGITIHRVPLLPRGRKTALGLLFNYLSFVLSGMVCGAWLTRGRRYDVIFVYAPSPVLATIPGLFVGWLKRVPVVLWVQDLWPESLEATGYISNRFVIGLVRQMVRYIYGHSDLLLVQSRGFEEPVRLLASGTPILYYPNSVDNTFAQPVKDEPPSVPGLEEGFSVLFAGNIGAAQAVNVIVEAALLLKAYKDIHFVVLGDGSCREEMLQAAQRQGLINLHLPGRFPVETMPGFMKKASALLVTLADRPIFAATVPNKIQAYLAAGRPIIACLNGEGARLVVEAGAGMACPAEDSKALAETILRLNQLSPEERDKMGRKGRGYYQQHFDHDHLVDVLIEHLHRVSSDGKETQ